MEDLKDRIPEIASEFTPITQPWITKRLHQELYKTGQLPDKETIRGIRDFLSLLDDKSKTIQKLDKISFKDMNIIQDRHTNIINDIAIIARNEEWKGPVDGNLENLDLSKLTIASTEPEFKGEWEMQGLSPELTQNSLDKLTIASAEPEHTEEEIHSMRM